MNIMLIMRCPRANPVHQARGKRNKFYICKVLYLYIFNLFTKEFIYKIKWHKPYASERDGKSLRRTACIFSLHLLA